MHPESNRQLLVPTSTPTRGTVLTQRYLYPTELLSSWQPPNYREMLTREIADARQSGDADRVNTLTAT